jgi:Tetracyclin repressor-like, C-terminal domain
VTSSRAGAGREPRATTAVRTTATTTIDAWNERVGGGKQAPAILLRGVIFWSRVHGLVSLELDRHLASMQLDAELLYRVELAELGGET